MVKTLTKSIATYPFQHTPVRQQHRPEIRNYLLRLASAISKRPAMNQGHTPVQVFETHRRVAGDAVYERQDAVMETLRILRLLRGNASAVPGEDSARDLYNLSLLLRDLGMHENSLAISEKVIEIYHDLSILQSSAFRVPLADSLQNAAACHYSLGHRDRALSMAREGLDLVHDFPNEDPIRHSFSLNAFSHSLIDVGRYQEAVLYGEQALTIRRSLVQVEEPRRQCTPDLAASLLNISLCYSNTGRYQDALLATEEAEHIYRILAANQPELFETQLASALHATSKRLIDVGRWEDALRRVQEELTFRREHAHHRPEMFNMKLIWSLMLTSHCLNALSQWEGSLETSREAVAIFDKLVKERPILAMPWLMVANAISSVSLHSLGQNDDALNAAINAKRIYCSFIKSYPRLNHTDVAQALCELSRIFCSMGRYDGGADMSLEAIVILRKLAESAEMTFNPRLAKSLLVLSSSQCMLDKTEDALNAAEEAILIYRTLASQSPTAEPFKSGLALALDSQAACFEKLNRSEKANGVRQEAADLHRSL